MGLDITNLVEKPGTEIPSDDVKPQENVTADSPTEGKTVAPLEFKPLDEKIIPPIVTDLPPVSEGDEPPAPDKVSDAAPVAEPAAEKNKGGRPPGSKNKVRPPDLTQAAADPEAQLQAAADVTFDISTGALSTFLGEEWLPRDNNERKFVTGAIASYYRSEGMIDIPPRTALILVVLAYSMPRMAAPKTKEKIKMGFYWLKTKIAGLKKKK